MAHTKKLCKERDGNKLLDLVVLDSGRFTIYMEIMQNPEWRLHFNDESEN